MIYFFLFLYMPLVPSVNKAQHQEVSCQMAFCKIKSRSKIESCFSSSCRSCLFVMRNAGRRYRFSAGHLSKVRRWYYSNKNVWPRLGGNSDHNLFSSKIQDFPENHPFHILIPDSCIPELPQLPTSQGVH